ncbi:MULTISPECIES: M3 family metallopeptidase [Prochlorococcus]|uniref:M3 family metallopeptidase n=1 Tax=Prochlorococcus TaxID=1218 RepID=UPI000533B2F0|nr:MULTISPECIES: M3 family metallopeptidase [Prochlorococcus]KGG12289.1 Oligopeptidase A [Prochlorococcus sp. MIT 0601]
MNKKDLKAAILVGEGIPNYEEITPGQIKANLPNLLKKLSYDFKLQEQKIHTAIKTKTNEQEILNWENTMIPLYKIGESLRWSWGAVGHLNGVCNSEEMREVFASIQPDIVRFSNQIGQSQIIYEALIILKSERHQKLDDIQKRILDIELTKMSQRGVGLENSKKNEFNSNSERLAELSTLFSNNVLDSTKEWTLLIESPTEMDGIPLRTRKALSEAAKNSLPNLSNHSITSEQGPWLISLDMPTYISIITYANNRSLRERVFKAYVSRASNGDKNNKEIIEEILTLRTSQAKLLGYETWAEVSLANKMATDVNEVEVLLEELRAAAIKSAKKELKELTAIASKETHQDTYIIKPWDINYWSEKLKKEKFNLDSEYLRPWFPLPQVLNGLFKLSNRLFDITIKPANGNFPKWHKDVDLFDVYNSDNSKIASFYLDPYSRPQSKRGGAWMDECLTRDVLTNESITLPIAYLICNQTPPTVDTPSLMSFEEVETLFHEFGHGLQHMLTTVEEPQAAGINNVEWDAVELPSQFMENWCLEAKTIKDIAKHWQTGEELPEEEIKKLRLNKTFNAGLSTLRQIHFALTDIRLHSQWNKDLNITPDNFRREIAKTTTVCRPIPEDNFLCAFSHIFAGGYAAGYYSYKWAEVLSSDAFSAFEEVGIDHEDEIKAKGKKFRETVLSLGGSLHPSEVFRLFRGRSANTKALIRHTGL